MCVSFVLSPHDRLELLVVNSSAGVFVDFGYHVIHVLIGHVFIQSLGRMGRCIGNSNSLTLKKIPIMQYYYVAYKYITI